MRRTLTQTERDSIFKLWKKGTGFSDIGRVINAKPGSIFSILREHGGIQPEQRKRSARHLTIEEREKIRVGLSAKKSLREIARQLNRSPSTISREINRNRGRRWYKAVDADRRAWRFARRPKQCSLETHLELRNLVVDKLKLDWSPEQISGWLKVNMPRRKHMQVSYESIYKTLYVRSRNVLESSLMKHLRRKHKMRHGKRHSRAGDRGTIKIVNGVSIHERSKHINIGVLSVTG